MKKLFIIFVMAGLICLTPVRPAHAVFELITNGGFETGDLTGWGTSSLGSGDFFAASGTSTPISSHPTVGASSGTYYAVSDQNDPGVQTLYQAFTVPTGSGAVNLSFDLFVNNWNATDGEGEGPDIIINPAGLSISDGPNQHGRVDILAADGGGPFDTGAGVLSNLLIGAPEFDGTPNAYESFLFDITPTVGAGGDFFLRFATVETQYYLNAGVDNVSILTDAQNNVVPEPATMLLFGTGLAGAFIRRRRKA